MTMLFRNEPDSRERLKNILIQYRENVLQLKYFGQSRKEGILRRAMLDAILDNRPENRLEFMYLLPEWLIVRTSKEQLKGEVEAIVRLVQMN